MEEQNNEELLESLIASAGCLYHGEAIQGKDRYHLQILSEHLEITLISKNTTEVFKWVDVLGAAETKGKYGEGFDVLVYPKVSQQRHFKRYAFISEECKQWVKIIQHMAYYQNMPNSDDPTYRRKLKIFLNPHSGRGTVNRT